MSDSDDWENQLDSDNEEEKAKKAAEDEKKKLPQEDVVDSAKIEKEKKEMQKKQQQEELEKRRKDNEANVDGKPKKKDLDKLFKERNKGNAKLEKVDTTGMTNNEKGIAMQMAQEGIMTDDLLGGDDDNVVGVQKEVKLNSEDDYKSFGKQTADILYKGSCPYRIDAFCGELFKELPEHCNAKQINEIAKRLQTIYNMKQKDERSKDKNVKKEKPTLKHGGAKGTGSYERNNNAGMINDVMGGNDDEDEYGEYGDEQGFKRENEAAFDFM